MLTKQQINNAIAENAAYKAKLKAAYEMLGTVRGLCYLGEAQKDVDSARSHIDDWLARIDKDLGKYLKM